MNAVLRSFSNMLEKPVVVLLIILILVSLMCLGSLIVEIVTEHRHLRVCMPVLMEELRKPGTDLEACIQNSGLLNKQKKVLLELIAHPSFTANTRDALAVRLLEEDRSFWNTRVKRTDLLARLGPMLGLLGTLIPLGPGIQALGSGDTETLSQSLLTAFDTTIAGIVCAAVAMVISHIRKKWYANYESILEALAECVLEVVNHEAE